MKLGLSIYLFLVALSGFILHQAGGNLLPVLGVVAGVVVYTSVCHVKGLLPEGVRFLVILLLLAQAALTMSKNIEAILFVILMIPLFIGATQAIWEMRNPPETRDKRRPEARVREFTAAFLACAGISFLLLLGNGLQLSLSHKQLLAGVYLLLGMVAWERCRVGRFKGSSTGDTLSLKELLVRIALFCCLGVAVMMATATVLPALSEKLVQYSPQFKLPGLRSAKKLEKLGPKPREDEAPKPAESPNAPEEMLPGPASATDGVADLPRKGTYAPPDTLRVVLAFEDPLVGERLFTQGEIYVRNVALQSYRSGQWRRGLSEGYWMEDSQDGKTDGKVTLQPGMTDGVAYTAYVQDADGSHLPHLAGVQQFGVGRIYVLDDECFQVEPYGQVKVEAVSRPQLYQLMTPDNLRLLQDPPGQYLDKPDERTKAFIMPVAREIFGAKRVVSEQIRLLAAWFTKNQQYSTTLHNPQNLPPLENFLVGEKKGFCEHYASAACLLLREVGVPCRIAYGYHGGVLDPKTKNIHLGEADSHAWVEVLFQDVGWVICDFTPPQTRNNGEMLLAGGSNGIQSNLGSFESVDSIVDRQNTKEVVTPDISLLELITLTVRTQGKHVGLMLLAAMVLAGVLHILKSRPSAEELAKAAADRKAAELLKQPPYFEAFTKLCGEFGHPYTPDQTLLEFLQKLKIGQFYHEEFQGMTDYHYATRYAGAASSETTESRWLTFFKDFARQRRQLSKERLS
jgi:transglutaminase-like putative cysteine protease